MLLCNCDSTLRCLVNIDDRVDDFVRIIILNIEKRLSDVPRLSFFNNYTYSYIFRSRNYFHHTQGRPRRHQR